jgi:hypothetical protein
VSSGPSKAWGMCGILRWDRSRGWERRSNPFDTGGRASRTPPESIFYHFCNETVNSHSAAAEIVGAFPES